jgi:hypothetical protein
MDYSSREETGKVLVDMAPPDGYVYQLFQMISMTWIWKRTVIVTVTVLRLSIIQRMVMLCWLRCNGCCSNLGRLSVRRLPILGKFSEVHGAQK